MKTKFLFIIIVSLFFRFRDEALQAQTIIADSIIQTSPCAGSNIYIPYTVSGGNFNFGNVFTAQLSNSFGSFSNPTNIGSTPYWGTGIIIGTIPLTATFGFLYKVRIISSSPSDTSAVCPNNVIVTTIAQLATVTVSPSTTICNGDSTVLSDIVSAQDYLWSTGETTQDIYVSHSGSYTVTVTDLLGCKTTSDPITITVQDCAAMSVQENFSSDIITVYPNPSSENITLQIKSDGGEKNYELVIYNMIGQAVLTSKINQEKTVIPKENLSQGIFIYKVGSQKGLIQTGKIIIQ